MPPINFKWTDRPRLRLLFLLLDDVQPRLSERTEELEVQELLTETAGQGGHISLSCSIRALDTRNNKNPFFLISFWRHHRRCRRSRCASQVAVCYRQISYLKVERHSECG